MVYVTVCLDYALLQVLGMQQPENECVKYNSTMSRKGEGGGVWCVVKWCCDVGCSVSYVPSKWC
jgi:hypothetical protein